MPNRSIAERIEHRRHDEVHECMVPQCSERARVALYVDGSCRLAGRDWVKGEFVDLCPGHDHELRRVAAEAHSAGFGDEDHRILLGLVNPTAESPLDRLREWQ